MMLNQSSFPRPESNDAPPADSRFDVALTETAGELLPKVVLMSFPDGPRPIMTVAFCKAKCWPFFMTQQHDFFLQ